MHTHPAENGENVLFNVLETLRDFIKSRAKIIISNFIDSLDSTPVLTGDLNLDGKPSPFFKNNNQELALDFIEPQATTTHKTFRHKTKRSEA
jgi:hypothetical protein